jgi:hypothetical protein
VLLEVRFYFIFIFLQLENKSKFNIPRTAKLIEVHDDSPEFVHRSPLQLFSPTQTNTNSVSNNIKSVEKIQIQQNFAPRKPFYNRQRFDSGARWNNSHNDNGFGIHSQSSSRFYFHGTRQNERFCRPQGFLNILFTITYFYFFKSKDDIHMNNQRE